MIISDASKIQLYTVSNDEGWKESSGPNKELLSLLRDTDDVVWLPNKFTKSKLKNSFKQDFILKPVGFWYGKGSSWLKWSASEMFGPEEGYCYKLKIDKSDFLILNTERKLVEFTKQFMTDSGYPDWGRVSRNYSGLEMPEYFWSLRHRVDWYYSVDVASGCTWVPADTLLEANGVVVE